MSSEISLIFATPIWTSLVENYQTINDKMEKYIRNQKEKDLKGKKVSNIEGWHSQNFDLKNEEVVFFFQSITPYIQKAMEDMGWDLSKNKIEIPNIWSIINKKGSSNAMHIHSNCYLSAAYYVKTSEKAGKFVVENPLSVARHSFPNIEKHTQYNTKVVSLDIEEGDLLLFPAYLPHRVNENKSDEDRIVISFNVNINHFSKD